MAGLQQRPAMQEPTENQTSSETVPELVAIAAIFKLSSSNYQKILNWKVVEGLPRRYLQYLNLHMRGKVHVTPGPNNEISIVFVVYASKAEEAFAAIQKEFEHYIKTKEMRLARTNVEAKRSEEVVAQQVPPEDKPAEEIPGDPSTTPSQP